MINVILAMTKNGGIGFEGKLPWHIKEELSLFKKITLESYVIVGSTTAKNLPFLKDRIVICLTRNFNLDVSDWENQVIVANSINHAMKLCDFSGSYKNSFIIGGAELYNEIFLKWKKYIDTVFLSIINEEINEGEIKCDKFVNFKTDDWLVKYSEVYHKFDHFVLKPKPEEKMISLSNLLSLNNQEVQYLNLIKDVMENGSVRQTRNGETRSLFGKTLKFDLREGFPLLTTKRMFFRGIVEELLFFIRGDTDSKKLEEKNVNIWKGNTNREFLDKNGFKNRKEGQMGPMYGYQWRTFNSPCSKNGDALSSGIDQLTNVIKLLIENPSSRRIMMTTYNPLQLSEGVLQPCHSIVLQFYVDCGYLDMYCYNRSSDLFLGLPFNIASSSLLMVLISNITNLMPRYFTLGLGDCHIYKQHYECVKDQLIRTPYKFPKLEIANVDTLEEVENLEYEEFKLKEYKYYPSIKAKMIA